MLKRQRSIPSFAPDPYETPDPAIDILEERVAKRRRQYATHAQGMDKGKAVWRPGESDGEEDLEDDERAVRMAPTEQAQRLEQAGEYKNVNTLLHDLHAEQRHRVLFSSSSPPTHWTHDQPRHVPQFAQPFASPDKLPLVPPADGPLPVVPPVHEQPRPLPSFTISIPSKDASIVDHVEVKRVTQRYEDTNRFLGSLFLSRRRQHDDQGGPI
ncbi:hypothetical protein C8Q80DRAFT_1265172 [Daedaleopsis nitida]|nr:hypothetical protein C8Q80DRAFT_1265172 [Daedaleopsis nitida]